MARAEADVLVVTEPGSQRTGELLVDELDLLGLTSQVERGREREAEAAQRRSEYRAVVWLRDDHQARIWLQDDPSFAPHEVAPSESPELLALRTAELLRGRLLPAEQAPRPPADAEPTEHETPQDLRIQLFAGPGLGISSYAEPLPLFSLGFGYRPWRRLMVGAFTTLSLARNAWQAAPEDLSTSQFSLGGRFGFRWLDPPAGPFRSQLLLRSALRGVQVRTSKGGPMEKGSAMLWGVTADLGLDGEYVLTPWFSLAAEMCVIVGFPLSRSASLDNGMQPGPASPLLVATENLGVDVQVATSFLAVASW